jgi:alpha-1,6-mannosyltransferase
MKVAGVVPRWTGRLAGLSDRAVFTACLAGLVAGIGLFLVLPLAPKFLAMHRLPTTRDFDVEVRPQGQVTAFWVVSMASFALAVWQWRRGRRPSWALLLAGVAVLHLLALLVPPVASKDVYAYSFYGRVQTTYGANPYLSFPDQHPTDPWHKFWSWRLFGPVYGPPFLLLLRLLAMVAGPSLLTWVVLAKLVFVAAELAAIWLLVRALRADPAKGEDPRWPLLLLGWNPMVLQSFAMSAHVDALLLLVLAAAILAHRRGRHLLAFLALVGCFLVKVYMGPLAALYAIWLAAGRPRLRERVAVVAGLGLLGTVLTALAYLPYASAGSKLFTSAVDVSGHFSSGSPPNVVRRLLAAVLPVLGLSEPSAAALGARLGRQLAIVGILVAFVLVARTLRAGEDPWPRIATFFLAYLLLTPWVFYWHEVPLLGIVAAIPWSLTSLVAVALSITLVPLAPAGPPSVGTGARGSPAADLADTLAGFASRYGGAVLVLWLGLRRRRSRPGSPPAARASRARPAPAPGGSTRRTPESPPAGRPPASPARPP